MPFETLKMIKNTLKKDLFNRFISFLSVGIGHYRSVAEWSKTLVQI